MSENAQGKTPPLTQGEKVLKQWYQGKLGERLLQGAQMALDRQMLRRGSRKQQDGTLGTQDNSPPVEEEMNIRVGDEINHYYESDPVAATPPVAPVQPKKPLGVLAEAAIAAALIASGIGAGAGVSWALGMFDQQSPAPQKYELRLEVE